MFISFQTLLLWRYLEKYLDKYPRRKKKKKEEIEAPRPKNNFSIKLNFFEKFPRKKTVSEYTCGFR